MENAYTETERDAWVRRLAEYAPVWLAEPFPVGDLLERQCIPAAKVVPIASGENERDPERLQTLGERGVDILQINVMQLGGLLSSRQLLQSLAAQGKQFVLTGAATPLEVVALAHLAAGFSGESCLGVDWPCFLTPARTSFLATELLKQPLPIESGCLKLPNSPGFGVEVNEGVLHRFPWKSGAASGLA
jgi:L-alanine-DL-glutamate epimerase-like enolase superfamily enzyme